MPLAAFELLFVGLLHVAPELNPLRRTFISAALGWGLCVFVRQRGVRLRYLVAISVLFVGYIRWQPWNSPLQLPLFMLAAPLVGVVAREWRRPVIIVLAGLMLVGSIPRLIVAKERPLVGPGSVLTTSRPEQYFINRPDLAEPHTWAASAISGSGCRDVGMAVQNDEH